MRNEICDYCGNDMSQRAEGECCNRCLKYDEWWDRRWKNSSEDEQ